MVKYFIRLTALSLLFLLYFPLTSSAQKGFTLDQLEQMLWGANQSVEAAYQRLKAALYEQEEAKLPVAPRLVMSSTVYPSGRTRANQRQLDTTVRQSISLYYPIIEGWVKQHYKKEEKETTAREMDAQLKVTKNEVLFALRQKYFQALNAQQLSQIYSKGSLGMKEILQETRRLHQQKRLLLSDVLLAEKKLLQLRQSMAKQQDSYSEHKTLISVLLGMDEEELLLAPNPSFSLPTLPKLPDLITLASENNPALKILKARKKTQDILAKKTRWDNMKLQLVSNYTFEEQQHVGTDQGSYLGLNLSVPLDHWQVNSLRRKQALSRKKSWGAEIKLAKNQLKSQLKVAYKSAKGLQAQYQFLEKQKEEAQARRRQIKRRKQYSSAAKIDYRQLIQAEQDFWEAEAQLTGKNWERFIAFYQILYLTGYNKALPAAFFPSGPSELEFIPSKVCLRTLLIKDSSFLSSKAEIDFFLFFCQTKGVGRILLPASSLAEEESLLELINKLAEQKISAYLHLNAANPEAMRNGIQELVSFNERNVWQANWRGIYLVADFEEDDLAGQIQEVKKSLDASAQELRFILQISLEHSQLKSDFWQPVIEAVDELAFRINKEEKLPPALEALTKEGGKSHWWVFTAKDFTGDGEQGLETNIQKILKDDGRSLGVVLEDYTQYRHLITH